MGSQAVPLEAMVAQAVPLEAMVAQAIPLEVMVATVGTIHSPHSWCRMRTPGTQSWGRRCRNRRRSTSPSRC